MTTDLPPDEKNNPGIPGFRPQKGDTIPSAWERASQQQFDLLRNQLTLLKQEFETVKLAAQKAMEDALAKGGRGPKNEAIDAVNQQVLRQIETGYEQVEAQVSSFAEELGANLKPSETSTANSAKEAEPETESETMPTPSRSSREMLQYTTNLIDRQMEEADKVMQQNLQSANELMATGLEAFQQAGEYFKKAKASGDEDDVANDNTDS